MTPFKAIYGRDPHIDKIHCWLFGSSSIKELLQQRKILLDQLKKNLECAQLHMKRYINKKRKYFEFLEGDLVLVKL